MVVFYTQKYLSIPSERLNMIKIRPIFQILLAQAMLPLSYFFLSFFTCARWSSSARQNERAEKRNLEIYRISQRTWHLGRGDHCNSIHETHRKIGIWLSKTFKKWRIKLYPKSYLQASPRRKRLEKCLERILNGISSPEINLDQLNCWFITWHPTVLRFEFGLYFVDWEKEKNLREKCKLSESEKEVLVGNEPPPHSTFARKSVIFYSMRARDGCLFFKFPGCWFKCSTTVWHKAHQLLVVAIRSRGIDKGRFGARAEFHQLCDFSLLLISWLDFGFRVAMWQERGLRVARHRV